MLRCGPRVPSPGARGRLPGPPPVERSAGGRLFLPPLHDECAPALLHQAAARLVTAFAVAVVDAQRWEGKAVVCDLKEREKD